MRAPRSRAVAQGVPYTSAGARRPCRLALPGVQLLVLAFLRGQGLEFLCLPFHQFALLRTFLHAGFRFRQAFTQFLPPPVAVCQVPEIPRVVAGGIQQHALLRPFGQLLVFVLAVDLDQQGGGLAQGTHGDLGVVDVGARGAVAAQYPP